MSVPDTVECRTPSIGKKPTRIAGWKFEVIRNAILNIIPVEGEGFTFANLAGEVEKHISTDELSRLGAVGWYTTVVKLELEVRGELTRLPKSSPQRLLRRK